MSASVNTIGAPARNVAIEGLLRQLREHYVFPTIAEQMIEDIRRRRDGGEYDSMSDPVVLCSVLAAHLREVSHDQHLNLAYHPDPQPARETRIPSPEQLEEWRQSAAIHNYGFEKIERLPGNVGYLDLRMVYFPEFAGDTLAAAMQLLANTHALIVDIRHNGGGLPAMVAFFCSYLVGPEPVHLNDFYWRDEDRTQQSWTLRYVPGPRYVGKPVYVLTSRQTFSGGEELAYNLKHLKRATLIGETTAGAAHPTSGYRIDDHFEVFVPCGRPINAVTGSNWEGTGVTPDIDAPAEQALKVAHVAALKAILATLGDTPTQASAGLKAEISRALEDLA